MKKSLNLISNYIVTLLIRRIRVYFFLCFSFLYLLTSCQELREVEVNPKTGAILAKYKEMTLPSTQVQFNPRSTLNSNSFQAGMYTDDNFGTITSESYTWLGVQPDLPTLNENATYEKISMTLQFFSVYGEKGVNNKVESFEVYQLAEPITPGTNYTRVNQLARGLLIGEANLVLQKNDTLQTDSIFTLTLDDVFGEAIFNKLKANDGSFNNDTVFNEIFKGIAIVPSSGNTTIVQFSPSKFKVTINYHEFNSAQEKVDKTYILDLGKMHYFYLNSNLGGTPLEGILPNNQDFIPSDDFRYLQSGTMISLKVDYNPLFQFIDSIENLTIQKAFITFGGILPNATEANLPVSLFGYYTDENNTWPMLGQPSADSALFYATLQSEYTIFGTPTYPGYYSNPQEILVDYSNEPTYTATMSNFIQHLHNGGYNTSKTPLEQKGKLLLFPPTSVSGEASSSPSVVYTNYFKVHKDSIKLKIYYSTPNL